MIYKNLSQQVEIILTNSCNQSCNYCMCNDTEITLTESKIHRHMIYINEIINKINGVIVCLVGGEIGLVDKNLLELFFQIIEFPVIVSTNGIFVNNNYHVLYKSKIKKVLLHVFDDIEYNDKTDISYGKVFSDVNDVDEFLIKNRNIKFDYIGIDYSLDSPMVLPQKINSDYCKLLEICENYRNKVTDECILRIKQNIYDSEYILERRNTCYSINENFSIDLENEVIRSCSGRSTEGITLNKHNLKKVLFPHKRLFKDNKHCDTCVPWCIDKLFECSVKSKRNNIKYLQK